MAEAAHSQSTLRRALFRMDAALEQGVSALAVTLMAAIVVDVVLGVVFRYLLNTSIQWTEAAGRWLLLYLIFVGACLAERHGRHIALEIAATLSPPPLRRVLNFVIEAITAAVLCALIVFGYKLTFFVRGNEALIELPLWLKIGVIPVTMAIALFFQFTRCLEAGRSPLLTLLAILTGAATIVLMFPTVPRLFPGIDPSLLMSLVFATTLLLGVPVVYSMLAAALVANFAGMVLPPAAIVQNIVSGTGSFLLLAIPLFIFAGVVMVEGGLAKRLLDIAQLLVGRARGGLAQVNVLLSFMFGGISGSASADVALDSKILVPEMIKRGYPKEFCCAVTSASSILTNVVPPSTAMLIFAEITGVSVIDLFIGGIGPGILLTALMMITVYAICVRKGYGDLDMPTVRVGFLRALMSAIPILGLAVAIIVGIRSGVFTPVEAGGVAVVYALALSIFPHRKLSWTTLVGFLKTAAMDAAIIGLLISAARPFINILYAQSVPQKIIGMVLSDAASPMAVLFSVIGVGLALGTILDLSVSILVLVPLVMPLLLHLGFDPTHVGVIIVVTLLVGSITPPVGLMVYMSASMTGAKVSAVFRAVTPFTIAILFGILLMVFFPWIVTGLVHAMH
ncbi:TRAP transporter large permease subunit [Rhodoligotrophos appendicifer]|uniref:TRAP transporter large permease n=1 Tax=Rhodoligotrophos appendicifer TaxID=987056 RepID=UPI001FEC2854|nr:TRAP transporter large permease subunit [Rhodoligotrophos appendicifer]